MDAAVEQRIQTIWRTVRQERAALAALSEKLTDLKELLKPAHNLLDDVEHFFLDAATLAEPRTPAGLARWLDQTLFVLQRAIQQREYVDELVKKYGPNARLIRG